MVLHTGRWLMKRKSLGVNVGSSSILLIFVLLSLISFAALSMVSANADYILCQKNAQHSTAYYTACTQANTSISSIDLTLQELYSSGLSESEYCKQAGTGISYLIPITDFQSLQVELTFIYPTNANEAFYDIATWKVITTEQIEYDNSLDLLFQ